MLPCQLVTNYPYICCYYFVITVSFVSWRLKFVCLFLTTPFWSVVPSDGPHVDDYKTNEDGCVELDWHPISEENRNGRILGYTVTWKTSCFSEHDAHFHHGSVNVSAPNTTVTVCDLNLGLEYGFGLAGFTSAGAGEVNHRDGIFTGKAIVLRWFLRNESCRWIFFSLQFIVIFLGRFCPREKGAMRWTLCDASTRETRPDHSTGKYVPYSFRWVWEFSLLKLSMNALWQAVFRKKQ